MKMIGKLTRSQLEALAIVGVLALLSAINVAAGVDRNLSTMAGNELTTSVAKAQHH